MRRAYRRHWRSTRCRPVGSVAKRVSCLAGRAILVVMAEEGTPTRSPEPSEVTVTFVSPPVRDRAGGARLAGVVPRGARAVVGVALAVAALGVVIPAALQVSGTGRPAVARRARVQSVERAERAAVAAGAAIARAFGYPYPRRCLTITISARSPDFARASVDRSAGCGRYRGYVNASFHLVGGGWRLVLDEGQLFVPNSRLAPCAAGRAGCPRAGGPAGGNGSRSGTPGSEGARPAYAYPLGCVSIAIALHDPRFGHARFDRTVCTRA
jgi:hypothetical protein